MNINKKVLGVFLTLLMILSVFSVATVSAATVNSASATDSNPGGTTTISTTAGSATGITVSGIPDGWTIDGAATQNDSGIMVTNDPDNDNHPEEVGWAWQNQGSHSPSLVLNVPGNAQTGQSHQFTVEARNGGTDTSTVSMTVQSQQQPPPQQQGQSTRGGQAFNPGNSSGDIGLGGSIFIGEDEATIRDNQGNVVTNLDGVPDTNTEGEQLDVPPPLGLPIGTYDQDDTLGTGDEITVSTPRVLRLRVYNEQGEEVSGSAIEENEDVIIVGQTNYMQAEDIRLKIENEGGTQITQTALTTDTDALTTDQLNRIDGFSGWQVIRNNTGTFIVDDGNNNIDRSDDLSTQQQGIGNTNLEQGDVAIWHLDLDELETETHIVRIEGIDDFALNSPFSNDGPPFGSPPSTAVDTISLEVLGEEDPELNIEDDTVTQGQRSNFEITTSTPGNVHVVAIEQNDMRDDRLDERVFMLTEDTVDRDTAHGHAYAIVRIDTDGIGIGRIDSEFLDDTGVDVDLFGEEAQFSNITAAQNAISAAPTFFAEGNSIDDEELEVEEGLVSVDNPGREYVAGDELDVNGTASEGIDRVVVYVRKDSDIWHKVLDDRASGGEWEEDDFELNTDAETSDARNLLSLPGVKRIGIIDAEDVRDNQGRILDNITTTRFNQGTSKQRSLRIVDPTLTTTFKTVDGQIFAGDGIDFEGTATGVDSVAIYVIDDNGKANVELVDVNQDDDTFDEDDYSLADKIDPGRATIISASVSRDGVLGDNTLTDAGRYDSNRNNQFVDTGSYLLNFANWVNTPPGYPADLGVDDRGLSHTQILQYLVSQTTGDDGSDDLAVLENFRFTDDSSTSINTIRPEGFTNITDRIVPIQPGETMEVMGITNRQSDDNTIAVEVIRGPDTAAFEVATTEDWPLSGEWSVTLQVDQNVTPGNYTIEAEDGDSSDVVDFQVTTERTLDTGDGQQVQELRERLQQKNQTINNLEQDLNETQQQRQQLQQQNEQLNQRVSQLEQNISNLTEQQQQQQPGFTPLVAIIAFVTIALLALKRRKH